MRRSWILTVAALSVALSACGNAQVAVTLQREVEDPETGETVVEPLDGVEVQLVPFDRDEVFDSLATAAATPEPPIPDSVMAAQEAVQEAQEEWRAAETRWQGIRDRLQEITQELEGLNRGESRYVTLFREFQDLEGQLNRVERQMNEAFNRFNELQSASLAAAEQIRLQRENWADEAFADVGEVMAARLEATGRDIVVDTTGAQGMVTFEAPQGDWWIHARYDLPYEELYWNVPVTLERGTPLETTLTGENAERRPKL